MISPVTYEHQLAGYAAAAQDSTAGQDPAA
jgi:hypothetical protein